MRNQAGELSAKRVRKEAIREIGKNRVENLYLKFRHEFYEALMGPPILVPEGIFDYHWLRLWQRVAESSDIATAKFRLTTLVPDTD